MMVDVPESSSMRKFPVNSITISQRAAQTSHCWRYDRSYKNLGSFHAPLLYS